MYFYGYHQTCDEYALISLPNTLSRIMKKLLSLLAPILLTLSAFAQGSNNCNNNSLSLLNIGGPEITPLCENMPSETLMINEAPDLSHIGFFITDLSQPANNGAGKAVVARDDDGTFVPADLELEYNNFFAISPFGYNLADFQGLVDVIFSNYANGYPCCEYIDGVTKDFCQILHSAGIFSANDVDSFDDVWAIVNTIDSSTGDNISIETFVSKFQKIQTALDQIPINCQYISDYCYAIGDNEKTYEVKEIPTVEIDATTPNRITINAEISSGILLYSLDEINWQSENTFYGTPSMGMAYVKEDISGCIQEKSFFNTNLSAELTNFEGKIENNITILEWTTATETSNDYFGIERASNATDFIEIARVDGAGFSSNERNYTFKDITPLTGTSYYRLMMYDFDGYSKESEVENIKREEFQGFTILSIGPNPSAKMINISIVNKEPGEIKYLIYDVAGRKAREDTQELVEGINNFTIDATMMGTGMYLFTASKGGGTVSTYKFVMH